MKTESRKPMLTVSEDENEMAICEVHQMPHKDQGYYVYAIGLLVEEMAKSFETSPEEMWKSIDEMRTDPVWDKSMTDLEIN